MQKRKLSLDEIKKIELNILLELKKATDANGLRFFISGGSLLGAIRHKGFIPWDDDIDVCMPRPDYEKLCRLYREGKVFPDYIELQCYENHTGDFPFIKLLDSRTEIEEKYVAGMLKSLWIDILPVDGFPEDEAEVIRIQKKAVNYRKGLMLKFAKVGEGKNAFKKLLKPLVILALKPFSPAWFNKRLKKEIASYPYETSKYVGVYTWGLYGLGERMLKSEFEKTVPVTFEGYEFNTFSCWHEYLSGLYGNYMELPPVEKRQTHNMLAWIREEG